MSSGPAISKIIIKLVWREWNFIGLSNSFRGSHQQIRHLLCEWQSGNSPSGSPALAPASGRTRAPAPPSTGVWPPSSCTSTSAHPAPGTTRGSTTATTTSWPRPAASSPRLRTCQSLNSPSICPLNSPPRLLLMRRHLRTTLSTSWTSTASTPAPSRATTARRRAATTSTCVRRWGQGSSPQREYSGEMSQSTVWPCSGGVFSQQNRSIWTLTIIQASTPTHLDTILCLCNHYLASRVKCRNEAKCNFNASFLIVYWG